MYSAWIFPVESFYPEDPTNCQCGTSPIVLAVVQYNGQPWPLGASCMLLQYVDMHCHALH